MCASNNDVMLYKRQAKFLTIRGLGLFLVDHLFKSTFHARARLVKLRSLLKRLETSRIFIFKNQFLQIHPPPPFLLQDKKVLPFYGAAILFWRRVDMSVTIVNSRIN